jgi:hypothetical protein
MAQINRPTQFGPAPTRHQVQALDLHVEALPGIGLRVSTPSARGWAAVARNPHELTRAITAAFNEAQVAAHARWRGAEYDLAALTDAVEGDPMAPPRERRSRRTPGAPGVGWKAGQQRPDTYSPADWVRCEDGRWRSPGGRHYQPTNPVVTKVLAARRRLGLPVE